MRTTSLRQVTESTGMEVFCWSIVAAAVTASSRSSTFALPPLASTGFHGFEFYRYAVLQLQEFLFYMRPIATSENKTHLNGPTKQKERQLGISAF